MPCPQLVEEASHGVSPDRPWTACPTRPVAATVAILTNAGVLSTKSQRPPQSAPRQPTTSPSVVCPRTTPKLSRVLCPRNDSVVSRDDSPGGEKNNKCCVPGRWKSKPVVCPRTSSRGGYNAPRGVSLDCPNRPRMLCPRHTALWPRHAVNQPWWCVPDTRHITD